MSGGIKKYKRIKIAPEKGINEDRWIKTSLWLFFKKKTLENPKMSLNVVTG